MMDSVRMSLMGFYIPFWMRTIQAYKLPQKSKWDESFSTRTPIVQRAWNIFQVKALNQRLFMLENKLFYLQEH